MILYFATSDQNASSQVWPLERLGAASKSHNFHSLPCGLAHCCHRHPARHLAHSCETRRVSNVWHKDSHMLHDATFENLECLECLECEGGANHALWNIRGYDVYVVSTQTYCVPLRAWGMNQQQLFFQDTNCLSSWLHSTGHGSNLCRSSNKWNGDNGVLLQITAENAHSRVFRLLSDDLFPPAFLRPQLNLFT